MGKSEDPALVHLTPFTEGIGSICASVGLNTSSWSAVVALEVARPDATNWGVWDPGAAIGQTECLIPASGGENFIYLYLFPLLDLFPNLPEKGAGWDSWCLCKCCICLYVLMSVAGYVYKWICIVYMCLCVCLLGIYATDWTQGHEAVAALICWCHIWQLPNNICRKWHVWSFEI